MNRLESLKNLVAQNPNDLFSRYGLAMEYANSGSPEEAVREFRALLEINPNYVAAWFQAGRTLEKMGRIEDARCFYRDGIEASARTGDKHARDELEAALDLLG